VFQIASLPFFAIGNGRPPVQPSTPLPPGASFAFGAHSFNSWIAQAGSEAVRRVGYTTIL